MIAKPEQLGVESSVPERARMATGADAGHFRRQVRGQASGTGHLPDEGARALFAFYGFPAE